jgi:hypothetical protein
LILENANVTLNTLPNVTIAGMTKMTTEATNTTAENQNKILSYSYKLTKRTCEEDPRRVN